MWQRHRVVLGMLGALMVLGALAPSAGAYARARVDRAGIILGESIGDLIFTARLEAECPMVFGGELRAGVNINRPGILIGHLEEVVIEDGEGLCEGGVVDEPQNLPWEIRVDRIVGPEPNQLDERAPREQIREVEIRLVPGEPAELNPALMAETFFVRCIYRGRPGAMVRLRNQGENGRGGWQYLIETLRVLEAIRLNGAAENPGFCERTATIAGRLEGLLAPRRIIVE